jgi:hypothetical protein
MDEGEEVDCSAVEAGGEAAEVLELEAGHMTCTRPHAESQKYPLTRGRRPHMAQLSHRPAFRVAVAQFNSATLGIH